MREAQIDIKKCLKAEKVTLSQGGGGFVFQQGGGYSAVGVV